MCVQAHCTIDWLPLADPVEDWQWIGPHGSGRSGVEMIFTLSYSVYSFKYRLLMTGLL